MSEEILKALMQLFALIAKQDSGVADNELIFVKKFLTSQLSHEAVTEYLNLFYEHADIDPNNINNQDKEQQLTSVRDSVRILGICKKINRRLTQKQKIVVLVRLFELVNADKKFTEQRMAIINTVAEVFNITPEEFESTEQFIIDNPQTISNSNILRISSKPTAEDDECKQIETEELDEDILILQIKSVELYFLRYSGTEEILLNGLPINNENIYIFANGSSIRLPKSKPIYYSDVISHFLADVTSAHITYNVDNVDFRFPNGAIGLRNISISEEQGRLIGIMGASGAGKTTLLNLLTGLQSPSTGTVKINGIDLHNQSEQLEGVIGSIPQDDLLISELTVYENLFYNAKLCFKDLSNEEIDKLVLKTLNSLGLLERKDLKVGSPLNKVISGGQRKRLNIALELIREPSILFVDEPTSGLSSRDSENVMDLLRELALKGKLIFVVIHQPSSDIYKMFDRMIILDTGGYMIYYGNPVEAVSYFKTIDNQINAEVGECPTCGNVNPELIFNIIDAQVVDEFGRYTGNRKVSPEKWEEYYKESAKYERIDDVEQEPPKGLNIPNWFSQLKIYTIRDVLSKISDKQYVIINLLEAPLLGFMLSFIVRYIEPDSDTYIFRVNGNIPIYIFMGLIVAIFLGFIVSAEEIFKDRKILKREAFLNLSRSSYLASKVVILFAISAIQSFLFIIVANPILELKGLNFEYWMALWTIAAFSNMLGLNISSAFNSAVTIYILIPLLMIPQMVLGGAMFSFDKLNKTIGSVDKVPLIAEFIPSRWCYEGLMVKQFKDNEFEKFFYEFDKTISNGDLKGTKWTAEIRQRVDESLTGIISKNEDRIKKAEKTLKLIQGEIARELEANPNVEFDYFDKLTVESFDAFVANHTLDYLNRVTDYYEIEIAKATKAKENIIMALDAKDPRIYIDQQNKYHNEAVADIVKNIYMKQVVESDGRLIKQRDPIFRISKPDDLFSFRTHFYAPKKHFMGVYFDTFWFNMVMVWLMTGLMYITLYYDLLKKAIDSNIGKKFNRWFSFINFGKITKPIKNRVAKIKLPRIIIRFRKK
ncbi:MAG TPA: ATP-binding cassette domain-containing protein [Salinivirgaceae bacterium]|nr:ATP-binding cassette domain-containing protein [Salinivirgaceae bacterium]HQA75762.1 ATP-binding cassette domain-containing protein [Salinivirgaceae bacterium]